MKTYFVYVAGGSYVTAIDATCITKACKQFIEEQGLKDAKIQLMNKHQGNITKKDNYSIMSDYVVIQYR